MCLGPFLSQVGFLPGTQSVPVPTTKHPNSSHLIASSTLASANSFNPFILCLLLQSDAIASSHSLRTSYSTGPRLRLSVGSLGGYNPLSVS